MYHRNVAVEKSFIIETEKGKYKVKVTDNIIKKSYMINIGGGKKHCVQIKIPKEGTIAELTWIEAGDGCSLDGISQQGELMVHMVWVGITVAFDYNKELTDVKLQDNAGFQCPFKPPKKIDLTNYDLAFSQKSYYEKRYDAVLMNQKEKEEYEEGIKAFTDPLKKPAVFTFNGKYTKELEEIYSTTSTWKDFFDKIPAKYKTKEEKCLLLAGWLKEAIDLIMEKPFTGKDWLIPIKKENFVKIIHIQNAGRRTRKQCNKLYKKRKLSRKWK